MLSACLISLVEVRWNLGKNSLGTGFLGFFFFLEKTSEKWGPSCPHALRVAPGAPAGFMLKNWSLNRK